APPHSSPNPAANPTSMSIAVRSPIDGDLHAEGRTNATDDISLPEISLAERPVGSLFRLDGQVAIVTVANAGLGLAISRGFCGAGVHVAVNGRRRKVVEEVAAGLAGAFPAVFDINDHAAASAQVDTIVERLGASTFSCAM